MVDSRKKHRAIVRMALGVLALTLAGALALTHRESPPASAGSGETREDVARPATKSVAAVAHPEPYWTCSMHPSVRHHEAGACPLCNMTLVAVTPGQRENGEIRVDSELRQRLGIRTEVVERKPLQRQVEAPGKVTYDESRLTEITMKFSGWVTELHADRTGMFVRKGDPLFTVYSVGLYTSQKELLGLLRRQRKAFGTEENLREELEGPMAFALYDRLQLWDLGESQIREIVESGEPRVHVPIVSPASGYVIEKAVVKGSSFSQGQSLYRLADLDRVWVLADVFESDLPAIRTGQKADIRLPFLPDRSFTGKIDYLYPSLENASRTVKARIEIDNRDRALRPEMYADVTIHVDESERLVVPREAVIYTGRRRLVFVDLGEGRLRPREVRLGAQGERHYEVLEGLEAGEVVVTSGNFLIAAESRIRSAELLWGGGSDDSR